MANDLDAKRTQRATARQRLLDALSVLEALKPYITESQHPVFDTAWDVAMKRAEEAAAAYIAAEGDS